MTHNWSIVIEFECFVCILWQVFIDDIQFFAILTILSIVISTQSWIEFKWFVCTLIRIWSGWYWGEWCSDYRLLRWLQRGARMLIIEDIVYCILRHCFLQKKNRHQNGWEDSIDKNLNSWRMEILIFDISYILLFAPPSAKQMEIRENLKFRFRFPPLERNKTSIHDGQKNIYCFDTFVLQNPQGKISF